MRVLATVLGLVVLPAAANALDVEALTNTICKSRFSAVPQYSSKIAVWLETDSSGKSRLWHNTGTAAYENYKSASRSSYKDKGLVQVKAKEGKLLFEDDAKQGSTPAYTRYELASTSRANVLTMTTWYSLNGYVEHNDMECTKQ
jgi:hypothetical protein